MGKAMLAPRSFGEHKVHKQLRKLAATDLLAGDILIAKEWDLLRAKDVAFVRLGQAVFSHVRGGSNQSEHVLMVLEDGVEYTAESLSNGLLVRKGIYKRDHVVYGCDDDDLRKEAAQVALRLAGVQFGADNVDDYEQKNTKIKYRTMPGMAASVFRAKYAGSYCSARIDQLYKIAYLSRNAKGVRMVCSEFVASCYEVAAVRLNRGINARVPPAKGLGVDPRGMTAKALEAVLNRAGSGFRLSGRYRGSVPMTQEQLAAYQASIQVSGPVQINAPQQNGPQQGGWTAGTTTRQGQAGNPVMGTYRSG